MSLDDLDPLLTQPKRLAALGVLANSKNTEFAFLREVLGLSDSDLSKQMSALTEAGYVTVKKTGRGRDRQTWFKITKDGRSAMQGHVDALNALVAAAPTAPDMVDS
ncbi:MAG: transcriptional regulator [Acidimicrobiales bacterium]